MNWYFFSAAAVAFIVGLIHSLLGEVMIFRKMRRTSFIPTEGGTILRESNVRILWATWHALTIFGWGMAFLLLWLAGESSLSREYKVLEYTVTATMIFGSVLVLMSTKGKHPGWVGLMSVALLTWFGG